MQVKIENENGIIEITTEVLGDLAGNAATSCFGVAAMANRNKTDGLVSLVKKDALNKGVRVDIVNDMLQIELHIVVEYGINIPAISKSIVNRVKYQMENATGIKVQKVIVCVDAVRAQ